MTKVREFRLEDGDAPLLAGLPKIHRDVLLMADSEGLSYADIAGEIGASLGTVRSRLHRARLSLAIAKGLIKKEPRSPRQKPADAGDFTEGNTA